MTEPAEGTLLWEPSEELKENARISDYMEWLKAEKDLSSVTITSSGSGLLQTSKGSGPRSGNTAT